MTDHYPQSLTDVPRWAKENDVSVEEARLRFAQYGILLAITDSRQLSAQLVLKGGNALDFVWSPNRSTKDLDFSILDSLEQSELHTLLEASLAAVHRKLGTRFAVQRFERQPPGEHATFVTYAINVGFAHADERALQQRMAQGRPSSRIVPLDVSVNEVVCEHADIATAGTHPLRVSTCEDIVAEKLRSLLQQPLRNRYRKQDLLDIAVAMEAQPLDRVKIARFLQSKASARAIVVSRASFRDPAVKARASQDYAALQDTTRSKFIAFDDAWRALDTLIASLDIADT